MRKNKINRKISSFFPLVTILAIGVLLILSSFYEKSWTYDWNSIRKQIKDSVKVAQYGGVSSGWVGIVPKRPKQFDRRLWIMKNATESELLKLIEYPNGTIKTIAYEGLIRKKGFDKKLELILKSIVDNDYNIDYASGCLGTPMHISDYLIDYVLFINDKSPPLPDGLKNRFNLSEKEIENILVEYRKKPKLWSK